jgi:hypothetical protein
MVTAMTSEAATPINIGSRRELFVDKALIASLHGARLQLHSPTRREIVFRTDAPWEGNACGYHSTFQDGDVYRIYYHGLHYDTGGDATLALEDHAPVMCMIESEDGIHWRRPSLGVCEYQGSTDNNIVLTRERVADIEGAPPHAGVLKDTTPDCPADERYKMTIIGQGKMYCLKSADGIRWSLLSPDPIVTKGAFDSQNLFFWDPVRGEYREYHRDFKDGVRDIMTAAAPDLRHFPEPQWLVYPGATPEHLYTNQVQPYYRAPHLFVGFPMRYTEGNWSDPVLDLPGMTERLARGSVSPRYGTAVTDALFMSSRDGLTFQRWPEAFIRPGPRTRGSWVYGDNLMVWGMYETPSGTEDCPPEITMYAVEDYWEDTWNSIRRYTLRADGFVSLAAPQAGGEVVTHPLIFEGGNLTLNLETSGAGGVQVELQDEAGTPIPGYALDDCPPIRGDTLSHTVRWQGTGDVRPLAGQPVRLRFVLRDADVYAFQFVPHQPDPQRPPTPPEP